MRIRIEHETTYVYEEPARGLIQVMRLTPRSHVGQHVLRWRIEPSVDGSLRAGEDALGNCITRFAADVPAERLVIRVTGDVETDETHGVVRGAVERAPDLYWLRDTKLTAPSQALSQFAEDMAGSLRADQLSALHALNRALFEKLEQERGPNDAAVGGAEAFARGHGLPQDHAHALCACARHLGIPARNVSGYVYAPDEDDAADTSETAPETGTRIATHGHLHAWAEAKVERLGWVAFDPARGVCAGPDYVRIAIGLDSQACAAVRGARYGGGEEVLSVRLTLSEGERGSRGNGPIPGQSQNQAQSLA